MGHGAAYGEGEECDRRHAAVWEKRRIVIGGEEKKRDRGDGAAGGEGEECCGGASIYVAMFGKWKGVRRREQGFFPPFKEPMSYYLKKNKKENVTHET